MLSSVVLPLPLAENVILCHSGSPRKQTLHGRVSRMVGEEDKVRSRRKLCNGYRRWSCVGIHEFTDEDVKGLLDLISKRQNPIDQSELSTAFLPKWSVFWVGEVDTALEVRAIADRSRP